MGGMAGGHVAYCVHTTSIACLSVRKERRIPPSVYVPLGCIHFRESFLNLLQVSKGQRVLYTVHIVNPLEATL